MQINEKDKRIIKNIQEITGKKVDIKKKESYDLLKHYRNYRIKKILLISSYDYFQIEEDGVLRNFFKKWSSTSYDETFAQIIQVKTEREAVSKLKNESFDLIIIFNEIETSLNLLLKRINKLTDNPILLLINDIKKLSKISDINKKNVSKIFTWNGDEEIILTIIQYFEDKKNLEKLSSLDYKKCILLIEDSIEYYSIYLQIINEEINNFTNKTIHNQLSNEKKILRYKRKPFILHTDDYEKAKELFNKYKDDIICIISDKCITKNEKIKKIGNEIIKLAFNYDPNLPILIQSSEPFNEEIKVKNKNIRFIIKNSNNGKQVLRSFIRENLGKSELIIFDKNNEKIRIKTIRDLEKSLSSLDEITIFNIIKEDIISKWLKDIGEIEFSKKISNIQNKYNDKNKIKEQLINLIENYFYSIDKESITKFSRNKDIPLSKINRIGNGSLGGKARGIAFIAKILSKFSMYNIIDNLRITIPRSIVLSTDIFDMFIDHNKLDELDFDNLSDQRIAAKFIEASLPATIIGDLRNFITNTRRPLIVRSSGLLEDSLMQPFAGIYESVVFPNESWETESRFQEICNSIKFVYASTYFEKARTYIKNTSKHLGDEKMGILIQEVSGEKHDQYFYPAISGVAKSYNYYPSGPCKHEEGIVYLALGLGKSIVDGGSSFAFCPERPKVPLFGTPKDYMKYSQTSFYALNLKTIYKFSNFNEEIFLKKLDIDVAKNEGILDNLVSTYFYRDDKLYPGMHEDGYIVLNFAPITEYGSLEIVKAIKLILQISEISLGYPVEIEFAINISQEEEKPNELIILQIRNMIPPEKNIDIDINNYLDEDIIFNSQNVLGNGIIENIGDILYVDQEIFDLSKSNIIVSQIKKINQKLMSEKTPYIIVGPGRWGSTDPWLGIPVIWSDIAGAKVIVETPYKERHIDPSQGSHFFHDMISSQVVYLITKEESNIKWDWIKKQQIIEKTEYLKHIKTKFLLKTIVDGKKGIGIIIKQDKIKNHNLIRDIGKKKNE